MRDSHKVVVATVERTDPFKGLAAGVDPRAVKDGGIAAGDVIYAVNRTHVPSIAELRTILDALKSGDPVVLQLERRGTLMYLAFMVE